MNKNKFLKQCKLQIVEYKYNYVDYRITFNANFFDEINPNGGVNQKTF